MDQKLASLKDDEEPKGKTTTKGGVQKLKFTPTVPTARRPKPQESVVEPVQTPATNKPRAPRQKPTGGLISTINDQPAVGTFAHGFGTFGKAAKSESGSIAGISRVKNEPRATSASADQYRGEESIGVEQAIDPSDPNSPVSLHVKKIVEVNKEGLSINTPVCIQIPGLHSMLDYGTTGDQPQTKPISLLGNCESEKVIDMDTFNQQNDSSRSKDCKSLWPSDRVDRIGQVRLHKSGRMSLVIGPYTFTTLPIHNSSTTALWAVDKEYGQLFDICQIEEHYVANMRFVE